MKHHTTDTGTISLHQCQRAFFPLAKRPHQRPSPVPWRAEWSSQTSGSRWVPWRPCRGRGRPAPPWGCRRGDTGGGKWTGRSGCWRRGPLVASLGPWRCCWGDNSLRDIGSFISRSVCGEIILLVWRDIGTVISWFVCGGDSPVMIL